MTRSYFIPLAISSIIKSLLKALYFPLWWYSRGLGNFSRGVIFWLRNQSQSIGAGVWLRNIFVPMYGQRDLAGRVISFVIRLVQIVFRGLATIIVFFLSLAAIAAWILLPVALLAAMSWQLYGVWN